MSRHLKSYGVRLISTNVYLNRKGRKMATLKVELKRKCLICGNTFLAKFLDSRYCSTKCSRIACDRRRAEEKRLQKLDEIEQKIPKSRELISIPEAVAICGVSGKTLYRLIKKGELHSINMGTRLIRIRKSELLDRFPLREKPINKQYALPKLYNLEPENCYTIGNICDKYKISSSSVWFQVRKYGIPTRQIGNNVYVPKEDFDKLYKSEK